MRWSAIDTVESSLMWSSQAVKFSIHRAVRENNLLPHRALEAKIYYRACALKNYSIVGGVYGFSSIE
jgi:hypothetical protein